MTLVTLQGLLLSSKFHLCVSNGRTRWSDKAYSGSATKKEACSVGKVQATLCKHGSCAKALSDDMTAMLLISSVHPFGQLYNADGS